MNVWVGIGIDSHLHLSIKDILSVRATGKWFSFCWLHDFLPTKFLYIILVRRTVAVMKHWPTATQLPAHRPSQRKVRTGPRGRNWSRGHGETPLPSLLFIACLSHITHNHLPGGGATHGGLCPPKSMLLKKMPYRHAWGIIWQRQSINWGYLFPGHCVMLTKPTSTHIVFGWEPLKIYFNKVVVVFNQQPLL